MKTNEGEVPQYYVENSHPAIISSEVFELVQHEMKKRKESGRYVNGLSCFSGKIICGDCGSTYGSKLWHSTSKYRRTIWQCNQKFQNEYKCTTPHLYEAELQKAFVDAFNSLTYNKEEILRTHEEIAEALTDTSDLDREFDRLQCDYGEVVELMQKCVQENANTALDQANYQRRYGSLLERYETIQDNLAHIADRRQERAAKRENMLRFLETLKQSELLSEFDEGLWRTVVDTVTVRSEREIIFTLRDGTELKWKIVD